MSLSENLKCLLIFIEIIKHHILTTTSKVELTDTTFHVKEKNRRFVRSFLTNLFLNHLYFNVMQRFTDQDDAVIGKKTFNIVQTDCDKV